MNELKHILKIKEYNDSYQFTYSSISYNRKFSSCRLKEVKHDKVNSSRCSISRSISNIKEYCFCNDFDYFFTLTLKSKNRNNIKYAFDIFSNAFNYYQKKYSSFQYLYVFERQKKGGLHLHGFVKGVEDLYINKNGHLSSRYFDKLGFQNFTPVFKVNPFYLIKYITKEPITELKHRYYKSKGLKKANITYLHCNWNEFKDFCFTFKSPFCKMVTISK